MALRSTPGAYTAVYDDVEALEESSSAHLIVEVRSTDIGLYIPRPASTHRKAGPGFIVGSKVNCGELTLQRKPQP